MEFQAKLFSWQDTGNHLIIVARGPMDAPALTRLFDDIRAETESLIDCKILVDLSDSACDIDVGEIVKFVAALSLESWPPGNKIAFVSPPEISSYHRLYFLRTALAGEGLLVGVFRKTNLAIDWLADLV